MVADARFVREFSLALETVRFEDEADLFQRVLDIASERHDDVLAAIAVRYRDHAAQQVERARQQTRAHGRAPDALVELARVAGRHPSHFGPPRPTLNAV